MRAFCCADRPPTALPDLHYYTGSTVYCSLCATELRSWNRYRMFLTDCDAADRKNDIHNSRLTSCHHVIRCQLCQAACAPFFSVDLLTNHKSRHRCPDGRPQERMRVKRRLSGGRLYHTDDDLHCSSGKRGSR